MLSVNCENPIGIDISNLDVLVVDREVKLAVVLCSDRFSNQIINLRQINFCSLMEEGKALLAFCL